MQISFEPYHIGSKVSAVANFNEIESNLISELKKTDYLVTEKENLQPISPFPIAKTIAIKNEVKIELNYVAGALNVISNDPESTTKAFGEIIGLLEKYFDLKKTVDFYEIISDITVEFNDAAKVIERHSQFNLNNFIKDTKIAPASIRFSDAETTQNKYNNVTEIILDPKPTNPNKFLRIKLLYRREKKDEIIIFSHRIKNTIQDFVKTL